MIKLDLDLYKINWSPLILMIILYRLPLCLGFYLLIWVQIITHRLYIYIYMCVRLFVAITYCFGHKFKLICTLTHIHTHILVTLASTTIFTFTYTYKHTHSLIHSLTYPLTHSPTHSLTLTKAQINHFCEFMKSIHISSPTTR